MKRLENKIAVVYSDGTVGGAVAKSFAHEGATVFLAGRSKSKQEAVAAEVQSFGGRISTSVIDALDEKVVAKHMADIIAETGAVDISFNAIGIPQKGIQGLPLTELDVESFLSPIITYAKSHFITSKIAARAMAKQGRGVIMMHVPNASRLSPPFVGGMVPAWAAIEGLCRSLSVEFGMQGVRSVCLLTTGIPETPLIDDVWEIHGKAHGISREQFHAVMEGNTHRKRLTTLHELTSAAVFAASDDGSAITGTTLNLTAGMIID